MASLITLVLMAFAANCGGSSPPLELGTDESDNETQTDTSSSSDPHSDSETHSLDPDTDPPPVGPGEPCYTNTWPPYHPNFGLPGCQQGLICIGNENMAVCTETCASEGSVNDTPGGLMGWCCGSPFEPCSGKNYWLPKELSSFCVPRTAKLGQECDRSTEWTGSERRCAPVCTQTQSIAPICAEPIPGTRLCTVPCDVLNGNADCDLYSEFQGGCCGQAMGKTFCLTSDLCSR